MNPIYRLDASKKGPGIPINRGMSRAAIGQVEDTVTYILGSKFAEVVHCETPFAIEKPIGKKDSLEGMTRLKELEDDWEVNNALLDYDIITGASGSVHRIRELNRINDEIQTRLEREKTTETTVYTAKELRSRAAKRAKKVIRRLLNSNPDMIYMETFTFAVNEGTAARLLTVEEQKDRDKVREVWKEFCRNIRKTLKKAGVQGWKWLKILELHDSEKTSKIKRGTYHLHVASNVALADYEMETVWGYGRHETTDFTKKRGDGRPIAENPGAYMSKYIEKDVLRKDRESGERAYTCSRNLDRPVRVYGRAEAEKIISLFTEIYEAPYCTEIEGKVYKGTRLFLSKPKDPDSKR